MLVQLIVLYSRHGLLRSYAVPATVDTQIRLLYQVSSEACHLFEDVREWLSFSSDSEKTEWG